jgi:glyoxylase-like metal-dependent hydrolase (beta-lactamase superfamily II)
MIPLEDYSEDIIGKVMRGRGISTTDLCGEAGISEAELDALLRGEVLEEPLRKVAPILDLNADALVVCANKTWYPDQPDAFDGFAMANTPFHDMAVNAYVVWDPATSKAVVFDSGADSRPLLKTIGNHGLKVELILLTHSHTDHVIDLDRLKNETGSPPIWINAREADDEDFPSGVQTFDAGKTFRVGALTIASVLTSGHSPGGTTFIVHGLSHRLAIVGDSLFAGSMGGSMIAYEEGRRNNIERVLTLPPETILAPGHGPLTTVEQEQAHNPFFAR